MVDFPSSDAVPLNAFPRASTSRRTSESAPVSPLVPLVRQRIPSRNSTVSVYSHADSDTSEIHAPVPRRHHLLQHSEPQWLHTPGISPGSSRPTSPTSTRHASSRYRHIASFATLTEEGKGGKPKDEDMNGWGRKWVRWMHRNHMRAWVIPIIVLSTVWVKWVVGLGGYSGYQTPPMYGDFEAQRHWFELTIHLPMREWYTYDLQYWGLDYPPLTAYHSWLCGKIGSWFQPEWFALDSSRGIETPDHKVFMRATVLVSDLLVYFPGVFLFVKRCLRHRSGRTQHLAFLSVLLQPALILIDSGHFQYNSVMLGFTLLCLDYLTESSDLVAAVFFVLSLGFKQMALYYAPAIGSYFLSNCVFLGPVQGRKLFLRLSLVTIAIFAALFSPWLSPSAILDPITRVFPFNRGLFEDKVANFWCASDVVVKWRRWLSAPNLVRLSTVLTVLGFSPAVWGLLRGGWIANKYAADIPSRASTAQSPCPTLVLLPYVLLTSSLSFFLFSFQVHEKSILLPLLPATLLLVGAESGGAGEDYEWGVLFNNVAVFSMWPLLKKDGLGIPYVALLVLWNGALGYNPFNLLSGFIIKALSLFAYTSILILHFLEALITPPARYPDIFPVLNVLVSAAVFASMWLWSIKRGVEIGWTLSGPPRVLPKEPYKNREHRKSLKSSNIAPEGTSVRRRSTHGKTDVGMSEILRKKDK